MTAPVITSNAHGPGKGIMQFIMPSKYTINTIPKPTDPRVSIRQLPERTLAVIQFSGTVDAARSGVVEEKKAILLEALQKDGELSGLLLG